MKRLCIYHGNCTDGFGSAWVVRKALGNDVEFFPGIYGDKKTPDVVDKEVIMVDFSYKRNVLLELAEKAKNILIIDHHQSAQQDLKNIEKDAKNVNSVFDMNHSGAILTWKHYFPGKNPHKLLTHIEDRDLWKFQIPRTHEIHAALYSHGYDFKVWDELMKKRSLVNLLAQEGKPLLRKQLKDIEELIPIVTRKLKIDGHVVPAANVPYFYGSDLCNRIAKNQPFAAYYYDVPDGRVFGLRSHKDGLDVAEIATKYGGGGHKHASGFKLSFEKAMELEI